MKEGTACVMTNVVHFYPPSKAIYTESGDKHDNIILYESPFLLINKITLDGSEYFLYTIQ